MKRSDSNLIKIYVRFINPAKLLVRAEKIQIPRRETKPNLQNPLKTNNIFQRNRHKSNNISIRTIQHSRTQRNEAR